MKKRLNPDEIQKDLSIRIKKRREELNLTYSEISKNTGLSASTLLRYENGSIKNIPADKIEILSDVLKMSPIELMGWNDAIPTDLSYEEEKIVVSFRKLNSNGKDKIIEYVDDISLINKYKNIQMCEVYSDNINIISTKQAHNDNQDSDEEQELINKDFEMMKKWKNNK